MMSARLPVNVTFSDCDPAGIVHYANTFRWMDAGFHHLLRPLGGHEKICARLGAVGIGLISASAEFRSPIRDGDLLDLSVDIEKWSERSVIMAYEARIGERTAFTGREVRGLFKTAGTGLIAAPIHEVRSILGESDVR